jgi:predicted transcriptional regulator
LKAPCEDFIWGGLPALRRELAIALCRDHGFNQKEAARRLGLTDAAVSQYMSGKHGEKPAAVEPMVSEMIVEAAARLASDEPPEPIVELCGICSALRR